MSQADAGSSPPAHNRVSKSTRGRPDRLSPRVNTRRRSDPRQPGAGIDVVTRGAGDSIASSAAAGNNGLIDARAEIRRAGPTASRSLASEDHRWPFSLKKWPKLPSPPHTHTRRASPASCARHQPRWPARAPTRGRRSERASRQARTARPRPDSPRRLRSALHPHARKTQACPLGANTGTAT